MPKAGTCMHAAPNLPYLMSSVVVFLARPAPWREVLFFMARVLAQTRGRTPMAATWPKHGGSSMKVRVMAVRGPRPDDLRKPRTQTSTTHYLNVRGKPPRGLTCLKRGGVIPTGLATAHHEVKPFGGGTRCGTASDATKLLGGVVRRRSRTWCELNKSPCIAVASPPRNILVKRRWCRILGLMRSQPIRLISSPDHE